MAAYGTWLAEAIDGYLSGETIKAMLVDDAYVFDPDEAAAPTGSEISGTGYTSGGVDVTSLVDVSYDSIDDQAVLALTGQVNFGTITATGIGAIVFYVVSGRPLVVDMFGSTDADGSEDFTYDQATDGVLVFPVA